MKNEIGKLVVLWLLFMGLFVGGMAFGRLTVQRPEPRPQHITDKVEKENKYYIETRVEVTPEEYIGLDIGDEYEANK